MGKTKAKVTSGAQAVELGVGDTASNVTPITKARGGNPDASAVVETVGDGRTAVGGDAGEGKIPAVAIGPALVVFGRDEGGKAHASTFGEADAELAIKAAGLMRYRVLPITTDEHRTAASGLAAGRIFASGKSFVPFAKDAAHEALAAFPEAYLPPPPVEPEPEPAPTATGTPQRWEDLQPGSLVLATVGPDEGWFEAIVTEARGEAIFVLRWQGWPDDPVFVRRADGLALLPARPVIAKAGAAAPTEPAA